MHVKDISQQLKLLQDELACLRAAEEHVQSKMDALLDELDKSLSDQEQAEDASDLSSLPDILRKFEAEHPELTDSVNRVLVTLGNMGI